MFGVDGRDGALQCRRGTAANAHYMPSRMQRFRTSEHAPTHLTTHPAGAEVIVCVSVNDAFAMDAWAEQQGAKGKVLLLADARVRAEWLRGQGKWGVGLLSRGEGAKCKVLLLADERVSATGLLLASQGA